MAKGNRINTGGGDDLGQNPFGALGGLNLPEVPANAASRIEPKSETARENRNRGRVDIVRSKAGRGGKTVTVVQGFMGIADSEKQQLAKTMQKICGCGGTVKEGRIEIQGDKRDEVAAVLRDAGFRPVFAGG